MPLRRPNRTEHGPQVNLALLANQVGVAANVFTNARTRQQATDIITTMVQDGRTAFGRYCEPIVVRRPDGSHGPWTESLDRIGIRYERRMLRAAAYVLLAALTGMRDSEIQEIERDGLHQHHGHLALRTHREKHGTGETISWWISDEVAQAVSVLERLSTHPTRVISPLANPRGRCGMPLPGSEIRAFIAHVNANRHQNALPAIDLDRLSPQMLRRTFAHIVGLYEGGDLAIAVQYRHASTATTASYQHHRPGDQWVRWKENERIDANLRFLRDLAARRAPVAGSGAQAFRDHLDHARVLTVTDPFAAEQLMSAEAATYHRGDLLDCRFDAKHTVCHSIARNMSDDELPNRPLLDLCVGAGCPNAMHHERHVPALQARHAELSNRAATAPSTLAAQAAARDLAAIDTVPAQPPPRVEMTTNHDLGDCHPPCDGRARPRPRHNADGQTARCRSWHRTGHPLPSVPRTPRPRRRMGQTHQRRRPGNQATPARRSERPPCRRPTRSA